MSVTTRRARTALWIVQGLLAALFLFAGGFKLAVPPGSLAKVSPLPPLSRGHRLHRPLGAAGGAPGKPRGAGRA
jgi:hypothetical protein